MRELGLRQPEVVDAFDETLERCQLHGLGEKAVGLQLIAFHDIGLCIGGGQDDGRYRPQRFVRLDLRQYLPTVHFGKVQVQQDEIGARGAGVAPHARQKRHRLDAVERDVQVDRPVGLEQSFLCQSHVAGTVFDQQHFDRRANHSVGTRHIALLSGSANRNVEPCPSWDSTLISPPCRSTIFLQIASPMPVPANSSRLCSRWNMPKIFSKYCGSIPSPLSFTANIHLSSPLRVTETCTWGTPPGCWYLMAFPTRFWNSS